MKISRKLAIRILKYLDKYKDFYFPFQVACKEYSGRDEVESSEWKMIKNDEKYQTFELQKNLQDLRKDTIELMAKGFIEKITGKSLEKVLEALAKNYRKKWREELWESEDIERFGLNEFIGGKAEGFEESLNIIKEYQK